MTWSPTPESELIVARVFLGDCWVEHRVQDLRPGEVVRLICPNCGPVHPTTHAPDAECVSVVAGEPQRMPRGYGVPVDVYENLDAVREAGFA